MHLPIADIPFQKEHVAVTSIVSYAIPLGFHYDLQGLSPLLNVMKGIFCLGSKSGCLHHMAPFPKSHRSKSLRWHVVMLLWTPMLGVAWETFLVYSRMSTVSVRCCQMSNSSVVPPGSDPSHVLMQVTWSAPLIPNGEIERYEIRMPDPRISNTNVSVLNRTISSLVPYTNYSITILACSGGGGHVGGCTESHPTMVTTSPTIPQGLSSLSVVAVSESFLAVSWHMPLRPNGPNIR